LTGPLTVLIMEWTSAVYDTGRSFCRTDVDLPGSLKFVPALAGPRLPLATSKLGFETRTCGSPLFGGSTKNVPNGTGGGHFFISVGTNEDSGDEIHDQSVMSRNQVVEKMATVS
jgi:hypothetical protein